jgi:NAD(P)H dehydrogenase (quinone)
MAEPIFLISGATGATGGATAEQLLEKNRHVRVLTHRQDERSERLKRMGTEVVLAGTILFGKIDKRTF